MAKTKLIEKIGYGFGDMSSSMFWKIFSYYLPFFYSNIFGLSLIDAGVLVLVTRIWDAVSDPMMGVIADRTNTKWGKYRPYLLWVAPFFSICGILLFTTPDWNYGAKLVWAYITYIMMMTVYTGINVPYGAMLGVMTDDPNEKTVFSSFRMFFAYGGSFISLFLWEPLTKFVGGENGYNTPSGWFWAMVVIATACFVMFIICFLLTREHLKTVSTVSVGDDFASLLKNKPWWLLIGAALCFNLFNTVRGATVAYFFLDIIGPNVMLAFFAINFLFYAGLFLGVGEVSNMVGVASCVPIANKLGKKTTFILVNLSLVVLSILFFFIPVTQTGFWLMLFAQIVISILTGIMSPLVWSMYADVSDYAELKYNTASTGLIFSSSSMAQKFGGAIGGAAVLWLLSGFGYVTDAELRRTDAELMNTNAQLIAGIQAGDAEACKSASVNLLEAAASLKKDVERFNKPEEKEAIRAKAQLLENAGNVLAKGGLNQSDIQQVNSGATQLSAHAEQLVASAVQPEASLSCLWWLLSFIPAIVALISVCIVWFYPLTTERIKEINSELKKIRAME